MNLAIVVFLIILFAILPRKTFLWRWIRALLFCIDCMANAVILLGDPRETISSRVGKAYQAGVWWIPPVFYFINTLFVLIDGHWQHCIKSIDHAVGDQAIVKWH